MLLRKTALLAMVAGAAMAWTPSHATAQSHQPGLNRAAEATAHADAVDGRSHNNSQASHDEKPSGIARVFAGMTLPPGIRRLFGAEPEPEPAVEPDPEPETGGDTTGDCWNLEFTVDGPVYTPCTP